MKSTDLLSLILSCFFDASERHTLDNKKVNKVVKEIQYLFSKDPRQKEKECFVCEDA